MEEQNLPTVLQVHSIETELQILATKKGGEKEKKILANETKPGVWISVRYC